MNKRYKDLGLLILIFIVGTIVAIINPLFISAVNLANTRSDRSQLLDRAPVLVG